MQDEVRALGRLPQLNVPEAFISRHPFPGGLSCHTGQRIVCLISIISFYITFTYTLHKNDQILQNSIH